MFAALVLSPPGLFILILILFAPFIGLAYLLAVPVTPSTSDPILASGNGKGNSALPLWWALCIGLAMVVCLLGLSRVASVSGVDVASVPGAAIVAIVGEVFIFLSFLGPVYGMFYHFAIVGTHIQADGNGIAGTGVGKGFIWGDPRRFGFRLAYNQITSVDVGGSTIIIHASGAQYKCYVQNPSEIQRVIAEQQQKRT
jgi:hypothetical protein